ncbi:myosin-2 heavy chain-like isoform X2 [Ptychodera flava]|uniref:myosin-2 heavy chain-like isoform X2 n=1 Tax=Ptychodera flava TaxID=63121 RepID=UPI003969D6C3
MATDNDTVAGESLGKTASNVDVTDVLENLEKVSEKNAALLKELENLEEKSNELSSAELLERLKQHHIATKDNNLELQEALQSKSASLTGNKQENEAQSWQGTTGEEELNYQLLEQMSRNVEMQNSKMKTELALYERIEALKLLGQTNKRLQADVNTSRGNTQKLLKLFDKRAKEAEKRLSDIEEELKRSQEVGQRYQDLYEVEKRKSQTKNTPRTDRTDIQGDGQEDNKDEKEEGGGGGGQKGEKSEKRVSSAKNRTASLYSDLQRKYQNLTDENDKFKTEIKRLKQENDDLFKRAKEAGSCLQILKSQVATSFADREKLQKQLRRQKLEQQKLERAMTKQANDWIESKKQQQRQEEEYRWSQIGAVSTGTVGAERRLYANTVTKQDDTPRDIPVEHWADNN